MVVAGIDGEALREGLEGDGAVVERDLDVLHARRGLEGDVRNPAEQPLDALAGGLHHGRVAPLRSYSEPIVVFACCLISPEDAVAGKCLRASNG